METWPEAQTVRVLEWYEKDPGEALVGDEELQGITVAELHALLQASDDDPDLHDAYEVEPHEVERLQQAVQHRIDLSAYDYFVAAYRAPA